MKVYLDTETCGFYGMPVLLQYAFDGGPINLYEIWKHPISETLSLIESFLPHTIVGFNLAFDWFQIVKLYTIFRLCNPNWIPVEHINEIAAKELDGRDGPCLKPASALDLMLHSRKGPLQFVMPRKPVRLRGVPAVAAQLVADELNARIQIPDICFAKIKRKERWIPTKSRRGKDFRDVILKFHPAGGLKYLAEYVLKLKPKFNYTAVEPANHPIELGYAPFASAISREVDGWYGCITKGRKQIFGYAWPALIREHIEHWATRADAREYASDDIVYTRALDAHFGYPPPGDNDSVLACMVAAVRWRGFTFDVDGVKRMYADADAICKASPIEVNRPTKVREYLSAAMDEVEQLLIADRISKEQLEKIIHEWPADHPAKIRAEEIFAVRAAQKRRELATKLLIAGRLHVDAEVIGAKSGRKSGKGGLNAQAINHAEWIRKLFTLAHPGRVLSGGDFNSFEVTIGAAVYQDDGFSEMLKTGKKTHALFGVPLFPGETYESIAKSAKSANDLYDKAKKCFFACVMYMGTAATARRKLTIPIELVARAIEGAMHQWPGIKREHDEVKRRYGCLQQPGGKGTEIFWTQPEDYGVTLLGFKRSFVLENQICKQLFELANDLPDEWYGIHGTVTRSHERGPQTVAGAIQSAIFGAAGLLSDATIRAVGNNKIQGTGAEITKTVERRIWDHQPVGVNQWIVAPMNQHDEVLVDAHPDYVDAVAETVNETVESFRPVVSLIGMAWNKRMVDWCTAA